ncbi:uncharacterized protein NPIL_17001 [Nephila pilipes]|uniref:Uncharacterized protein n=1 Tax=Nephila pilipes TaxID=299642 RepID=A0A8X6NQA7_NEPPI|nr:uncharacterized protein NPIL_17001 [Nephila pilipes]
MVKILVEIQASHVGIGKSTFVKKLNLPYVDDCIQLVESDPAFFYGDANNYGNGNDEFKHLLRSYLVLENYAASLDQLSSQLETNCTVMSSRSPIISCIQFATREVDWKPLLSYYKKRLEHLGVGKVLILDYGTVIQENEEAVKRGFQRMNERGRMFEKMAFNSYEKYHGFFQRAEQVKLDIVDALKKDRFFHYINIPVFHDFNEKDVEIVRMLQNL